MWSLDEVVEALAGGNPNKEFYEGGKKNGTSEELLRVHARKPSAGSKRPKISFSRPLVDEPDLEIAPDVTQVVGDTLDGIPDVSTKCIADVAPGTDVVEVDEVPSRR